VGSFKPFSEEMFVELGKLRWLKGETSPLELAVLRRASHSTDALDGLVIAVPIETLEFRSYHLLIILYIVSNDDIGRIEVPKELIHYLFYIWSVLHIAVVYTVNLGRRKRNRDTWTNEYVDTLYLYESVHGIHLAENTRELDYIWLLVESSVANGKSGGFCVEYECFHRDYSRI
jgi:hypothetical protein